MLFNIGIEPATNENEAYGIIVPVFNKLGYGCNSAADNEKEIIDQVTDAILLVTKEMMLDGLDLELLNEGATDYSQTYSDFTHWLIVDVNVGELKEKPSALI